MVFAVKAGPDRDRVVAMNSNNGKLLWISDVMSTGRVMTDGVMVYTAGRENYELFLAALDINDGKQKWIYNYGTETPDFGVTAPVEIDRKLLWCTGQEILILNTLTGELENRIVCARYGFAAKPVISGSFAFGTFENNLICIDVLNDTLVWKTKIDEEMSLFSRPEIAVFRNNVYIAGKLSNNRAVAGCYNVITGNTNWKKYDIPAFHLYATDNGAIFRAGSIISVDEMGATRWRKNSPGCSPLTIQGSTALYFDASENGGLVTIDLKTGREEKRYNTGNNCTGILISDKIGLLCTNDGVLKAFKNPANFN
jgi:outer membrane protein assembly factor BamB